MDDFCNFELGALFAMKSPTTSVSLAGLWLARFTDAAFGVTTKGNSFSIDTNAGLVFDVSR
jgi:hypothetical protein